MKARLLFAPLVVLLAALLLVAAMFVAPKMWSTPTQAATDPPILEAAPAAALEAPLAQGVDNRMVLMYSAKFVCTEAIPAGTFFYGAVAPLVNQKTDVLIHNPHGFEVTLAKKAVIAPVENFNSIEQGVEPGKWRRVTLKRDYAFRIDCDDIAKLLTGNANATFVGTYGVGVTVEGFVVIGIGPQTVAGTNFTRFAPLDVTAEYVRSSEVMKKDINYQPWWWWWWDWQLPWQLGYPYERILPISQPTANIDCRGILIDALKQDTDTMGNTEQASYVREALDRAAKLNPNDPESLSKELEPTLVPLIGRCNKLVVQGSPVAEIDYVLVSTHGPSQADPLSGNIRYSVSVAYPWVPGRWYDLAVVVPQNRDINIDGFFREWQAKRWEQAGGDLDQARLALRYYLPYWCGWGYWSWWWNSGDCIDIGVGEGESLDVEQITPTRAIMRWPPQFGE